jgi:hypothetical protein
MLGMKIPQPEIPTANLVSKGDSDEKDTSNSSDSLNGYTNRICQAMETHATV